MGRTERVVILGLLGLVVAGIVSAPVAAAESPTSIQVSVNGNPVPDGERVTVPEANLSVSVTGDVEIASVLVRIDGERRHEATPNATAYETTLDPDFSSRSNDVQVIVKDENGDLATHRITVYRDTLSPKIELSSPFAVSSGHQFPDSRSYTAADVTLSGTVWDASNITSFSARIIGGGPSTETTTLSDGSFSLDTTFALGNNSLVISATDEYGHLTHRTTDIEVTDDDDPSVTIKGWPARTEAATIHPTIVANDSVAVQSVTYRIPGQPERTVIEPTDKLLDAGRTSVTRKAALEFHRAGTYNVTFNVTDYAGHWSEETKTIEYDPVTSEERVAPDIQIVENRSGLYNDSRYRLTATVRNGVVTEIHVESAHRYDGVTFFETMYTGSNVTSYTIETDVPISPGHNEITIRVTDALETTHKHEEVIETASASAYVPPTTVAPTTAASQTTQAAATSGSGSDAVTTTPPVTQISVTEPPPLTAVTETSSPTSPLLSLVAFILVGLLLRSRAE